MRLSYDGLVSLTDDRVIGVAKLVAGVYTRLVADDLLLDGLEVDT